MSKADDLYYQYRRKLNQENGTRQGYRREKSSGQGTRNERYINEVLGGQGQPVQPSQASTSAPKTRQQILQEYRNGIKKSSAPSTTSSPVYSPDGAFFPKKNPYEGTTTKRPNPLEKIPYSDPLARAFNEKTGWRDPGMQALYELAERTQDPQRKITQSSIFRSGPIAGSDIGPRSRSFETANRAVEAEKEAAEQAAAGIQFDRSEAVKRRQSNIIPQETIESITDQYDMRPSYMRQQGDLPAAQDDRTRKALEQIYNSPIRVNQDNPVVEGFVRGTGIPSIINAGVNAVGAATGDQDMRNRMNREYAAYLQQSQQLSENNPIAYGAGNIAGNIALMSGIGKVIGAGAGAINTASTAGRAALRMGASALNFAATTAIQEAGAAAGGFTTPDNYARDVLVSGGAGMASAVASMAVAGGLEKVLSKSGLGGQYVFLDYLKNLSSATAGAGARVGVDYAAVDKDPTDAFRQAFISNHPGSTEEDIQKAYVNSLRQRAGEQFVTAFVFNLISSYMDTLRSTERAHYDLQREYDELEQVMEAYGKNPPRNAAEAARWANDVHTEAGRVRSRLNNGYYAGQQDKIDKILPLLDEIDERANQWASNYSGISGPAPAPEPTPEFVQEIGAAMQQGAENPPAVINPDEPIQAPAAQEPERSTTDMLSEIANTPMPAAEEPIVPPAVNTNVDNINADVDESIPAATEEDLPTTKEKVPTTETTAPTTEEIAPVEKKAPQEIVQQEEKPAEKPAERTTTDMLQEIANTEYEAPAAEEAPAVEQSRAEEIQQAPVSEAPAPLNETPAESKIEETEPSTLAPRTEFATEEASKLSADLFQRKRVDQNGLRYTIRGDDGEFFGSIERIGAGNVKNSRDTIYNVGPKATLKEVADDLAEVAENNHFLEEVGNGEIRGAERTGSSGTEDGRTPGGYLSGEGSRWPVSLSAGERNGSIPSAAGVPAESSWRAGKDAADPEAGTLRFTGEVPATQIFPEAEPGQVIHLVSSGTTPSVNKGGAVLKAAGAKKVTYYGSDNDIATIRGEQVRASVNLDTGEVNIRVNDPNTTAEQQSYHEAVEIGVGDGRIVVADAMKHLKSSLMDMGIDAAGADEIITKVSSLYQQGNTTPEGMAHANKEMVCDGGARINQFDGVEGYEDAAAFMQVISDILHPYCNEKLGGAFDAEAEDVPVATMEGVTPEQAKALETVNTAIDIESGSANALPIQYSADLWNESQYVKERAKAVAAIRENLKVSKKKAEKYIDDINSVAKMIVADRGRYDYKNSGLSPFVSNAEYGGSFDYDTLCVKRGTFIGTFQAIQSQLPNTALTRDEVLAIRKMMDDEGLEVPCGKCYVEGSRAAMGEFTKKFLDLYKKYYPNNWQPNMAQANTPDGIEWIRLTHPECYEQYEYFWNHYGTLKPGDPNLFASQQKPKLYMAHSAYSDEILKEFRNNGTVIEKNRNGGIRFQSFSDFEIIHAIDVMQAVMDMSVVGLNGQAYTKQPNFAAAFGNTGLKINLSIDAWDVDENGRLVFNNKEGMPFETAMELRSKHSENVGTICCVYDDRMLLAALADDRIDFIIPFHRSQWKKSQYKAMGLPSTTKDYTYQQNEKWLNPSEHTHEYRGKQVKTKCLNYMPNDYWDFSKTGKQNAEAYLEMCYRDGKRPKFYKFLDRTVVNGKAKFSLKKDGSTDGYWKLLIDFKMYDNDGVGVPQRPVRPDFDMQEIQRMFDEYAGDHHSYPVANGIVDRFVSDYKKKHPGIQYSSKLNLSGKKTTSKKKDSSGNELTVQQEEYFKDSKIRDEDGNLLVVYHGTSEDFTVFDRSKGRSNMDIQGSFFSPWDIDAEGYGPNVKTVYLNIKNPAPEGVAYKALNMFKGQNGAGIKAREYLISRGYDGVNNGDEEYIAFYPEQIKNIDNLAPTENEDIRYSSKLDLRKKEKQDSEYMAAVNSGDMSKAAEMVTKAAADAGFTDAIPEQTLAYKVRTGKAPTKTQKVYKVFTVAPDGAPTALFVSGTQKLPQGVWLDAQDTWHFEAKNGKFYVPSTQNPYTEGGKTGGMVEIPNEEIRNELIERGFLPEGSKAKSVTALAYRPGWHAGDLPFFPQGGKQDKEYVSESSRAKANKEVFSGTEEHPYQNYHRYNQVVFECEMAFDKDYTKSHIGSEKGKASYGKVVYEDMQEMPVDGGYKFATNPMANANDIGSWFISGSLKIGRALSQEECDTILRQNGRLPQLWEQGKLDLASLGYTGPQKDAARKTLAPVTYDDEGNVIPLSARFDPDVDDVRYSTKLNLQGKRIELTEREEKLMEQLSNSYLERIEQVTAQKDAQIAELKEKMKVAVGAEKEKARQRIEKLRQEKNDRIAYLEKQWRQNTNWRIAELKKKAETKLGEQHDDMIRRLANLQAQKDKKIDEILAAHRAQKQAARDKRNDRKLRVKFQKLAQKALRESRNKPGLASERVQELLKDIDLTALGMRDDTRTSLHNKLLEIMEMRKTDENYLALHAEQDWKKVERLFKKQIKDMSLEEVNDLITELSALCHYQETTDRLIKDEQNRTAAEVGRQIVKDLKELTPLDITNPVKVLSAKYLRDNLSPDRAFNRLSGYKRDSAMRSLYRQVLDGYTKVKEFEKKSDELFDGFRNDPKNKEFLKNGAKQTIPVTSKYGQTALISPAMRVSLYMASRNRDNLRHISTDGMTVPEPKAYAKGLIEDAYGRGTTIVLDPVDVNKVCANMTESEKEFASLLETFFDGYAKEAINDTSVELDGILKAIVDHYFPIASDKNFLAKSMDSFQDPTLEGWNNLKARQENANNKILLEDARQVLQRHIRNTARYYGLAIPMRNWNKVYGYTSHRDEDTGTRNSVQSAIKNAWNSDTADYIERLIRDDINSGGRKAERGVMDSMRSAYAGATLTLNAGVALKQTTSYFMAGSILDMESLMYGLSHKFKKTDQEYMDSITPWGWARRQGESTIELGEMARRKDPITKNTPNWNQAMDVITTNALFTATERSIRKEYPGLKRGDTKYDEALAERYNQVLWRTQPQYESAFRPEYLRKTDIGSRTFGMFKTESMQMSGELIDAWGQWRADEKRARSGSEQAKRQRGESAKHFYKTFASWIASNMSFAMMGTALNILLFHKGKPYRNDRGEVDWQTIATKTGMNFISSLLGGFMFASTAFDFGSYLFNIISGNKATWYDIEVPGISMINDMVTNTGDWVGTLLDEDATPAMKARASSKFALAASKFTPLGFAENLLKLADSVNLYVQDIREGIKTGDWHMYEAGDGFLQDTLPTKDQYAHQAVYYAGQGNVERAGRALKRTKKANLEKALGRKVGDTMFARFVENPQDLVSYMKTVASNGSSRAPKLSDVPEHGFSSFTKLKEGLGSPNRNENWHHIVEQEQGPGDKNFGTFTATQINNANNVVSIPSGAGSVHKAITDYYGSVQDFTDGMTVREWLAKNKSFEEQFDFGIEQLRKFGDVAPTERGWVFIPNEEKIDEIPLKEGKTKELTASQKRWDTKIAEAREDGGLTDREIRAAALQMLNEGVPKDEVIELYKSKKNDKYIDEWMKYDGESGGDLSVYFGFMNAKSLGNQDGAAEYLNESGLSDDDKWALWELAGWSETSFDKKVN